MLSNKSSALLLLPAGRFEGREVRPSDLAVLVAVALLERLLGAAASGNVAALGSLDDLASVEASLDRQETQIVLEESIASVG